MDKKTLEMYMDAFASFVERKSDGIRFDSFQENPYLHHDEDKQDVFLRAREVLKPDMWKKRDIGTGKMIFEQAKQALDCNEMSCGSSLVSWQSVDDFKKMPMSRITETERVLFDLYRGNDDAVTFRAFMGLFSYDLIAYLFFVKDMDVYLPVRSENLGDRFKILGIEYPMAGKCG